MWSALRTAVRAVFLAALIAAGLFRANVSGAVRGMEALGELDAQLQSLTLLRSEMQTMPGSGSREGFAADSASRRIHAALTKFQQSGLATAHYRPLTETVLRYTETVLSQVRLARNGLTVEATQLEPRARRQRAELRRLLDATRTRSGSDSQTALALDQSSRGALAVAFVSLAGLGLFRLRSSGPAAGRTGGASAPVGGETPRPVPLGLETGVDSCLVLDGSSVIRTAGASVLRLLGQTQDQILDHTIWEHLHPDDQGKLEELVRKAGIAPDEEWRVELRLAHRSGVWLRFDVRVRQVRPEDTAAGLCLICRDATDGRQTEQALRESEQRYALAERGANDGLWDWRLDTGRIYYSTRWKEMIGHRPGEVGDGPEEWLGRVHPEDQSRVRSALHGPLLGLTHHFGFEFRILDRDGEYRWMLCRGMTVSSGGGRPSRLVGSQTDITSRKQAEARLRHVALHDQLTGLPNRAHFALELSNALERWQKAPEQSVAVLLMDLDRFKFINDSLGHHVGDRLLQAFARRVQACLRERDVVARLGGDEFAVLLEGLPDLTEASHVAQRIQQEIRAPFDLGPQEVFTSASIGIASVQLSGESGEALLRDADIALYEAKRLGKARHSVFDGGMLARISRQLELENDLRRAVEREEFIVHYQPILSIQTGAVLGLEALVRWLHPQHGLLSPNHFVPLAEESGLITRIDQQVMRRAMRQLAEWRHRSGCSDPFFVSVNLSARRLAEQGLVSQVEQILEETGLEPHCLRLEMTKTAIIDDPVRAAGTLELLRSRGINVAMDDFGTGYSSLSHLHRFPFNVLKLDQSFLRGPGSGPIRWDMVETIIQLAHNLEMSVVAEGVETEEQVRQLYTFGCDAAQGYFWSPPRSAEDVFRTLDYMRASRV